MHLHLHSQSAHAFFASFKLIKNDGTWVGAPAGERTKKLPSSPCLGLLATNQQPLPKRVALLATHRALQVCLGVAMLVLWGELPIGLLACRQTHDTINRRSPTTQVHENLLHADNGSGSHDCEAPRCVLPSNSAHLVPILTDAFNGARERLAGRHPRPVTVGRRHSITHEHFHVNRRAGRSWPIGYIYIYD